CTNAGRQFEFVGVAALDHGLRVARKSWILPASRALVVSDFLGGPRGGSWSHVENSAAPRRWLGPGGPGPIGPGPVRAYSSRPGGFPGANDEARWWRGRSAWPASGW